MTIWNKLSNAVTGAPGIGALIDLVRQLGPGEATGGGAADAASPRDSVAFTVAIIALSAKLARSDGAVTSDEVEAFRRIVDVPQAEEANVRRLFDQAKKDVAGYETYAARIGRLMADDPVLRREVLEALFVVAAADGILHTREDDYLRTVAGHLGLHGATFDHVHGLFFAAPMGPYEVLELTPHATDADLRTRYRSLVMEHHPDRLAGRGCSAEFIAHAEQKLALINAAYDTIARERGL